MDSFSIAYYVFTFIFWGYFIYAFIVRERKLTKKEKIFMVLIWLPMMALGLFIIMN